MEIITDSLRLNVNTPKLITILSLRFSEAAYFAQNHSKQQS